jgi:hypothetical protein
VREDPLTGLPAGRKRIPAQSPWGGVDFGDNCPSTALSLPFTSPGLPFRQPH